MEDEIKDGLCYCQCEGAYEQASGICPVHPPQSLQEMRKIVKQFSEQAYKDGRTDAIFEMDDFIKKMLGK